MRRKKLIFHDKIFGFTILYFADSIIPHDVSPIDKIRDFIHQQKNQQHNLIIHNVCNLEWSSFMWRHNSRHTIYVIKNVLKGNLQRSHSINITVGGISPTTKSHLLKKLIKFSVSSISFFSWFSSSIDAPRVSFSSSSKENTEFTNPGRNLYLSYN